MVIKLKHYNSELFQSLKHFFEQSLMTYVQSFKMPYFNIPKESLTLDIWSVRLKSGGFQASHLHPFSWISGVYYSSVPEFKGKEGGLEFGVVKNKVLHSLKTQSPKNGLLVLFPSYIQQRTVPIHQAKNRVCVAFDT